MPVVGAVAFVLLSLALVSLALVATGGAAAVRAPAALLGAAVVLVAAVVAAAARVLAPQREGGTGRSAGSPAGTRTRVEDRLHELQRDGAGPVAVLVAEVDGVDELNATLGHAVGADVVRSLGQRLAEVVPEALLDRLGEDRFVVVVPGTDATAALGLARDLRGHSRDPVEVDGRGVHVDVAVGVVVAPEDGVDLDVLLSRAGVALVAARATRTRAARFVPAMDAATAPGGPLARELHDAIDHGQMRLRLQPVVDLRDGDVHAVEALVRWEHPEMGLLGPEDFVPGAARTGAITRLIRWALDAAAGTAAALRAGGHDVRVDLDLAGRPLDDDLVADVRCALVRHGLPGSALALGVDATTITDDPTRRVLAALADLGVVLSLRDRGGADGSDASEAGLPVGELRIAPSFVTRMADFEASEAVVRAAVERGRRLGVPVVAVGVQDERTAAMLVDTGCHLGQGTALAPALTVDDLVHLLERRAPAAAVRGAARGSRARTDVAA